MEVVKKIIKYQMVVFSYVLFLMGSTYGIYQICLQFMSDQEAVALPLVWACISAMITAFVFLEDIKEDDNEI